MLIQWNDSLSVNVGEIDRQHQRLVGMINDLNEAMRQGKGKDVLGKIVNGLITYATTHFRTEEGYFDQFAYPAADGHKKEHSDFTKKVSEFKDGFEKGKLGLSIQVLDFLSDWLQNHIKGVDKKYGPFFNEKGLK
ncbi:MAG TPA: bacteriohemerythrin [Thermodesulfobacteriota bacterium]|nr:bacteriohemerythrin [Thermodesulfobacteriota bacterium]